jgi:hypothetical protein
VPQCARECPVRRRRADAITLPAPPDQVWPWLVQLGKDRGGWYLPRSVERYLPPARRAVRRVVPELQHPAVGDTVPDWGGREATLTLVAQNRNRSPLHASRRGSVSFSWALVLARERRSGTRVKSRVRLGPVKHEWLAGRVGGALDLLSLLGLAHGLRERVTSG